MLVYAVYVCFVFLVFKIMCLKLDDGQYDRNVWHLWTELIKVVLADGSAYVKLLYAVPQRDEFHKKRNCYITALFDTLLYWSYSESRVHPQLLNKFTRLYETWREHYSTTVQLT